ncbi:MAG: hypothetical protein AAGA48_34370 [Myxococcota bacterium]
MNQRVWITLLALGCTVPCDEVAPLDVQLSSSDADGSLLTADPRPAFGPQGGQHLWLAVTVGRLGPAPRALRVALEAVDDTETVGGFERDIDDPRQPGSRGSTVLGPLRLIVASWTPNAPRRVWAQVDDDCGASGTVSWSFDQP